MKKNNSKPVFVIAAGMISVLLIYGLYKLFTKKKEASSDKQALSWSSSFCKHSSFPLRYGSCGQLVVDLQKYLNTKISPPRLPLKEDGKMGNKTISELKRLEGITTVSKTIFTRYKAQLNPFTKAKL